MGEQDENGTAETTQLHLRIKPEIEQKAQRVLQQMHDKNIGIGANRSTVYHRAIEFGLAEIVKRLGIEG